MARDDAFWSQSPTDELSTSCQLLAVMNTCIYSLIHAHEQHPSFLINEPLNGEEWLVNCLGIQDWFCIDARKRKDWVHGAKRLGISTQILRHHSHHRVCRHIRTVDFSHPVVIFSTSIGNGIVRWANLRGNHRLIREDRHDECIER